MRSKKEIAELPGLSRHWSDIHKTRNRNRNLILTHILFPDIITLLLIVSRYITGELLVNSCEQPAGD